MRSYLIGATLTMTIGCASTSQQLAAQRYALPEGIVVPRQAETGLTGSAPASASSDGAWTHVVMKASGAKRDFYLHGGAVYEMMRSKSQVFKGGFPYLAVVTDRSTAKAVGAVRAVPGISAPAPALAVIHYENAQPAKVFDFTVENVPRRVTLLSEIPGIKLVDIFEADCIACTGEFQDLKYAAATMRSQHGSTYLVTSASSTFEALHLKHPNISIVPDAVHSIYGALEVQKLPLNYMLTSNGTIARVEVGQLNREDFARDIADVANR